METGKLLGAGEKTLDNELKKYCMKLGKGEMECIAFVDVALQMVVAHLEDGLGEHHACWVLHMCPKPTVSFSSVCPSSLRCSRRCSLRSSRQTYIMQH